MPDQSISTVRELIMLLSNTEPLSQKRINQLYSAYQDLSRINFSAPEHVQQAQLHAIKMRQKEYQSSLRHKLWADSLTKDSQNNLQLHAHLTIELFMHFISTGDVPPPASPWRVAVLLGKRKEAELEKSFLAAWVKHFGNTMGTTYEKLRQRYDNFNK